MGQPVNGVSSTYPLSAVYSSGELNVYWAYNPLDTPTTVKFSDNTLLNVPAQSYGSQVGPK
jgi:hypothetical protein